MDKVLNPVSLELKIPPVALVLITAALMWLGAWSVPRLGFPVPGRYYIAGGVALAGAFISILGLVSFKRAKTTVNPMKPESSSSLVVAGIYGVTRNPMYLGFLLILLGWAAWLSNVLALLPIAGFVIYMTVFQIRPEERALDSLFGQEFAAYKGRVRRWI
jgi:protein-S-isoprenylcysteine O-methyltransferase Ste14